MRIALQRVSQAQVDVDGRTVGRIGRGLLLLVGLAAEDGPDVFESMARKVVNLRIFPLDGESGGFERSLLEIDGELLAVSQFTLYASCRKGRRPSFSAAAPPEKARPMFEAFVEALRAAAPKVATGEFGAMMDVSLINDGPVTVWLDSDELAAPRNA